MSLDTRQDIYAPSPDVLRWVADAVGPGTTIQAVRPLAGATSSTLHSIEVSRNGRRVKLVLRQFTNEEWLEEEPDLALHEATSLQKVAEADVPTPEVIAYDADGSCCGVPAILMTLLPGRVELKPMDFDDWLFRLAEAIAPVHEVEVGEFSWRYAPYNDVSRLEAPDWSRHPKLWERALEIVNEPWPETRDCFIHRDYHPVNVLWQDSQVSGIVDWPNACRGPAGIDVAWCRGNLAPLYGVKAADQFLRAYQSLAGSSFEYDPYWDLMVIIEGLPGPPGVYSGWTAYGVRDLTPEIVRERADQYLVSVMARL